MSVCDQCEYCRKAVPEYPEEELYECSMDSENFGTDDGCYQFDEKYY